MIRLRGHRTSFRLRCLFLFLRVMINRRFISKFASMNRKDCFMKNSFFLFLLFLLVTTGCRKEVAAPSAFLLEGEWEHADTTFLLASIQTGPNAFFFDTIEVKEDRFEISLPTDSLIKVNLLAGNSQYSVYLGANDTLRVAIRKDSLHLIGKTTPFATWSIDTYLQAPVDSLQKLPAIIRSQVEEYREENRKAAIGEKIPYILFKDIDGKNFSSMESNGACRLITFWATWDSASVQQVKELASMARKMDKKAIQFITISLDANDSIWKKEVKALKIPGRNVRLKEGFVDRQARLLGVHTLPQNMVLNTESKVVLKNNFGKELQDALDKEIELLKNKKQSPDPNRKSTLKPWVQTN